MKSSFLKPKPPATRLLLRAVLPLACLCACAAAPAPEAEFFLAHIPADPDLRIEDAYKWLFHATRGGEHAIENESSARLWLENEWQTLGHPLPDEPLWVPLTADGRVGRLNLRPYRARNGSPDALHTAFLAGAESFDPSAARFRAAWNELGRILKARPAGHLTRTEWQRLDRDMQAQGYPAIHHSPAYVRARQPAYRVLPARQAAGLLEDLAPGPVPDFPLPTGPAFHPSPD